MPFLTRLKVWGHADMQLPSVGQAKPAATPGRQGWRLAQLRQTQNIAEKVACSGFAVSGSLNQHVIQSGQEGHGLSLGLSRKEVLSLSGVRLKHQHAAVLGLVLRLHMDGDAGALYFRFQHAL